MSSCQVSMFLWLAVLAVAACAQSAAAAPRTVVDSDFGSGGAAIPAAQGPGHISGRLPAGWRENSEWAKASVTYTETAEQARTFTHVDVTSIGEGWAQIACNLPDVKEPVLVRLSLTMRSPTAMPVQIGVRLLGTPYTFLWDTTSTLSADWEDYAFEFPLEPSKQPAGLFLVFPRAGTADIDSVRMVQLSYADLRAEIRAKNPRGGPPNLLRCSRFPLGVQSGWSLGREDSDGDDVVIAPDKEAVGPSGAPSLSIRSEEPWRLFCESFSVPAPIDRHTASLYARGEGTLTAAVIADGRILAATRQTLKAGADWQRIAVPFDPDLMARAYCVRLEGTGNTWIDAMQVAEGKGARPYVPQMTAEVALACPPSDASVARVQFEDEPTEVLYAVTGAPAGSHLAARAVDVYGDEKPLPAVTLGAGFLQEGRLSYLAFPERPLGPFRVEAWVEDADGKRISPQNELVVFHLRRPRYWGKDAPLSPFGVHTLSTTRHDLMAKAVGANWTRLHDAGLDYIGWYHVEPRKGDWTFHDKEIERYRRDHITVLGLLSTAPFWASYYPGRAVNGYFDRFYQPKNMEDFANYVRTITKRYDGVIDTWDVWNEPWIQAWWPVAHDPTKPDRAGYVTSRHPQADFVRLMKTAYETAKSVDPKLTILGVETTNGDYGGAESMSGNAWTKGIVEAGGLGYCDVYCYHHYAGGVLAYPGDEIEKGFESALGPIIQSKGRLDKPVWMTEGSAGRELSGNGMYRYTVQGQVPQANIDSADRLCRFVLSLLGAGCQKVFLYSMHAHNYFGQGSPWAVLVTPEGYLHPSAAGHSEMAYELEDTQFVRRAEPAKGVYAYLFEARDGSRSVAVLAPQPGHAAYAPSAGEGGSVRDVFGNPLPAGQALGETLVYVSAPVKADELAGKL
jgi:hypothetical protein